MNIEPIVEDYQPMSELESLIIKLHNQRKYLTGFPSWLRTKAQSVKLRVLQSGKVNLRTEISAGYSFILWEPTY